MVEKTPTILATSGGFRRGDRTMLAPSPLLNYALELADPVKAPRLCHVGTASGDQQHWKAWVNDAFAGTDVWVSHLALFPMPSVADMRTHLLSQDVVWVGGGSVAGLLAMWRLHGLDEIFREVWEAGVVLAGMSAGSICWHTGGVTDAFGPTLRPVTNALGLLPYANGVHHDSEPQRQTLLQQLVAAGELPQAYATDDHVGLVYRHTEFIEAVSECDDAAAYHVSRNSTGAAVEVRIEPRRLPEK
jgi:peptidase E